MCGKRGRKESDLSGIADGRKKTSEDRAREWWSEKETGKERASESCREAA